ncbi:MAG: hypothetical protein OEY17_03805 [Nitrosopumilus sp.]|nr:hypothetical protein [Nitrosopumilus sp.]MDH5658452.1 hypothetical protein [Nitrosopumilus sp.]
MDSDIDISQMFYSESLKLQNLIEAINTKTDMNVREITDTYYQVINVSSIAAMLKQHTESEEILNKIQETEKMISERFNSSIHPEILTRLSLSIQEMTKTLQSENFTEKSKEQIEYDAKLFEDLRQKMSTREFVQQYEIGISHD